VRSAYYAAVTVVTILVRSDAVSASDVDSSAAAVAPDYGISAVLAATLGALSASGVKAGDRLIVAVGILAFVALLPFSIGWVDIEHPLAFGLGAAVVLGLGSHHARALRRQR
jgi:hypothetical protein